MAVRKTLILFGILTGTVLVGNSQEAVTLPETQSGVSVQVNTNGDYEIQVRDPGWTFGGNVGYPIQEIKTSSGQDTIGAYQEVTFRWNTQFSAGIRHYDDKPAALFSVNAPAGANATNVVFPSFTRVPANLHGFSYREENFAPPSFKLEQNGTPWLLFDDAANTAVLSPATNFLVARLSGDGRTGIASRLNSEIGTLEKPLTHRSLLVFGRGVGATFQAWGGMLTDLYGKKRPPYDADPTLKYFGYWTDNGADYYYRYDKDLGYRGTLLKLVESYRRQGIALGYFQLDSWWYQKSTREPDGRQGKEKKVADLPAGRWNRYGGTMDYTADPDLFPKGLAAFQKELGMPLVVHGRWVDRESLYQKQYKFSGIAPIDPAYWEDRMAYLATNGVCCYEQDWLDRIYFNSDLGRAVGFGDAFADGMAAASAKHDLAMQYCMPLPRHFLQGAKYSNLTTIRTCGDRFEPGKWRPFLYTSQLASALGIWPWCDVFKSSEMGNMILAVLSAGAVGTGDAMGKEVPENIRLAARADGVLVKPDRPMVPTDDTYLREAAETDDAKRVNRGFTAWTSTDHGDHRTLYGFAFVPGKKLESDTKVGWTITPATLNIRSPTYVYDVTRKQGVTLAAGEPYSANLEGGQYAFVIIAPVGPSGIAFLGDPDKIASTGKQRIADIHESAESLKVTVLTAAGESAVTLHGFADGAPACQLADGKDLPVQYDATSKHFTVAVTVPATGGEYVVTFRHAGIRTAR
jgi:hypothetical protein